MKFQSLIGITLNLFSLYVLNNNKLKIAVKKVGAELCQIYSVKNKKDFMWDANPKIWGSYAPNLFPIIGALKNNTYTYENQKYKLDKHGFTRNNKSTELHDRTQDSLIFKLIYSKKLLKVYPFKFEFFIKYKLKDNFIDVTYTINNVDTKIMYFSVGGHPAFKCPVYDNENYNDYILEFESNENSRTHLINMDNGLISSKTKPIFKNYDKIQLIHDLFNQDALVFKDLKSKKVTLKSKLYGDILTVSYKDFKYLGLWAKPKANYVCIEPWLGIADKEETNQNLKDKEGILTLAPNTTFKAS